jgi:hypothetical protein
MGRLESWLDCWGNPNSAIGPMQGGSEYKATKLVFLRSSFRANVGVNESEYKALFRISQRGKCMVEFRA